MTLHLIPVTPRPPRGLCAQALAEALAHVLACRAKLTSAPGRDEPCEQGLLALHAIETALGALGHAVTDLADLSGSLETVVDQLHDMASDVTGEVMKRMEQPAYDPHAECAA